MKRRNTEI